MLDRVRALFAKARDGLFSSSPASILGPILHTIATLLWLAWAVYMTAIAFRSGLWFLAPVTHGAIAIFAWGRYVETRR